MRSNTLLIVSMMFLAFCLGMKLLSNKQNEVITKQTELLNLQQEYIEKLEIKSSDYEGAFNQCIDILNRDSTIDPYESPIEMGRPILI